MFNNLFGRRASAPPTVDASAAMACVQSAPPTVDAYSAAAAVAQAEAPPPPYDVAVAEASGDLITIDVIPLKRHVVCGYAHTTHTNNTHTHTHHAPCHAHTQE